MIIEFQDFFTETVIEVCRVPARQICSPAVSDKQGVSRKQIFVYHQADAVRTVSRSMEYLELQIPDFDNVVILCWDVLVRRCTFMGNYPSARPVRNFLVPDRMIPVAVSVKDVFDV